MMGKEVAITVIITTYNLEKYINRTLQELWQQTFQDFEILLVDDASTDKTRTIVEEWIPKFAGRISTIFLSENLGMPALTRNVALDSNAIHGQYLLFLDGDDSIENNMLEELYKLATASENLADVVICAYDRVDVDTGRVLATEMCNFPETIALPPTDDMIAFINTSPWNKLWRREVIADVRYPAFKVGEEVSFNFKGYQNSTSIVFTKQVLIHYNVHGDSVISNTNEDTIWKFADDLYQLYLSSEGVYKDIVGLLAFIHIGLSMALRAADNPKIDLKRWIKKVYIYFEREEYNWLKGNPFLRWKLVRLHGVKGVALWCAYIAYRMKVFEIALKIYRKLGINIKF